MSITGPFGIRVSIAPYADPYGDPDVWGWIDVSSYVRHPGQDGGQAITYQTGRQDESTQMDTGGMDLTLDNRDGRFSSANPLGPYYLGLTRNTPIRLETLIGTDTFNRTAVPSNGWGTSSSGLAWVPTVATSPYSTDGAAGIATIAAAGTATSITLTDADAADSDVTFTCWSTVVATGAAIVTSGLARYQNTSNFYFFRCEFGTGGTVTAKISRNLSGGLSDLATAVLPFTYTASEKLRVRYQLDGPELRIKIWKEAGTEPANWTLSAEDSSFSAGKSGLYFWRVSGNTNAGSTTQYVDDYAAYGIEFTGAVVQWPVRWNMRSTNCWAPIRAAGIIRRLSQSKDGLRSPLYRQLSGRTTSTAAYWPLEDASESSTAASALTGGTPARFQDVSFGTDDTLPGADAVLTFNSATSRMQSTTFPAVNYSTGCSVMLMIKLDALPAAETILFQFASLGRVAVWRVTGGPLGYTMYGWDDDGVNVFTTPTYLYTVNPLDWVAIQVETDIVGANTEYALLWHQVGANAYLGASATFAGTTVTKPYLVNIPPGAGLAGASFAHFYVGDHSLPFVDDTFSLVSNGYEGELAADRIARLCAEEGVPVAVEPGDSEPLGRQRSGRLLDLLRAAEAADMGVLYEHGLRLGYRPREARYSTDVLMALSVAAGQISEPPEPILDDQRLRNDWTVSRDSGSSARALDQISIDTEGRYADSTTINVATDDVLPFHAGWRLHLGLNPDLRWPGLSLDFARNPDLLPEWRSKSYGSRITVDTGLEQAGTDPDVIVEGYSATLWPRGWQVRLSCSAARPWDIPVLDDDDARLDVDSDLAVAATSTATSLVVAADPNGPIWGTQFPYALAVEGEEVTATALGSTYFADSFGRVTASGWGTASSGGLAWSTSGGVATDYSTDGLYGLHNLSTVSTARVSTVAVNMQPREVLINRIRVPTATTGVGATTTVIIRVGAGSDHVSMNLLYGTSGAVVCWVNQFVDGVETAYDAAFPNTGLGITSSLSVRFLIADDILRGRVWTQGTTEPVVWQTAVDTTADPTAGDLSLRTARSASSTNAAPFYVQFDEISFPHVQTLTVTRSVNGIVKAQRATAKVSLARPMYLAL